MKYIRYTKYTGEPGGGVDLQELVKRLSDFFLQSGYESQFYGISEMDPEKSMEALRQAIQRALEEGDLLPGQELQDLLDGTPEEQAAKMKEMIDQLMDRLMEEGLRRKKHRADRWARAATATLRRGLKSPTRPSIF